MSDALLIRMELDYDSVTLSGEFFSPELAAEWVRVMLAEMMTRHPPTVASRIQIRRVH